MNFETWPTFGWTLFHCFERINTFVHLPSKQLTPTGSYDAGVIQVFLIHLVWCVYIRAKQNSKTLLARATFGMRGYPHRVLSPYLERMPVSFQWHHRNLLSSPASRVSLRSGPLKKWMICWRATWASETWSWVRPRANTSALNPRRDERKVSRCLWDVHTQAQESVGFTPGCDGLATVWQRFKCLCFMSDVENARVHLKPED